MSKTDKYSIINDTFRIVKTVSLQEDILKTQIQR